MGVKFHNNSAFGLGTTSSYGHGGAISFAGTSLSLVDCEFTANRTRVHGGAIYNTASASTGTLSAVNSTFYGNTTAAGSGGAIYNTYSPSTFLNSIFWGNTASVQGNQVYNNGTATSAVRSCDVQGIGSSGSNGNIDQDPLFVSTSAGSLDLKLQSGSPCINKGANAELPADVLARCEQHALASYRALGCSGHARPDLRINKAGEPFVLEVNTLPGMTATSLLPKIAKRAGMSYASLCEQILETSS